MDKASGNPIEQFLILSKNTKGAAAVELIKQVLETPGVYVFGELLDVPNIKELADGPYSQYYNLLELFAFGKLVDYTDNPAKYPHLTNVQLEKLRHLTIMSLATDNKCLPYTLLLKELQFNNLRELEDLIISVICADIIRGKLDQKQQQLQVEYAIGRDVRAEDISQTVDILQSWCLGCESVLNNIEMLARQANYRKDSHARHLQSLDEELGNLKKSLKLIQQQEIEDQLAMDLTSTTDKSATSKKTKYRGMKTSVPCFSSPKTSSKQ